MPMAAMVKRPAGNQEGERPKRKSGYHLTKAEKAAREAARRPKRKSGYHLTKAEKAAREAAIAAGLPPPMKSRSSKEHWDLPEVAPAFLLPPAAVAKPRGGGRQESQEPAPAQEPAAASGSSSAAADAPAAQQEPTKRPNGSLGLPEPPPMKKRMSGRHKTAAEKRAIAAAKAAAEAAALKPKTLSRGAAALKPKTLSRGALAAATRAATASEREAAALKPKTLSRGAAALKPKTLSRGALAAATRAATASEREAQRPRISIPSGPGLSGPRTVAAAKKLALARQAKAKSKGKKSGRQSGRHRPKWEADLERRRELRNKLLEIRERRLQQALQRTRDAASEPEEPPARLAADSRAQAGKAQQPLSLLDGSVDGPASSEEPAAGKGGSSGSRSGRRSGQRPRRPQSGNRKVGASASASGSGVPLKALEDARGPGASRDRSRPRGPRRSAAKDGDGSQDKARERRPTERPLALKDREEAPRRRTFRERTAAALKRKQPSGEAAAGGPRKVARLEKPGAAGGTKLVKKKVITRSSGSREAEKAGEDEDVVLVENPTRQREEPDVELVIPKAGRRNRLMRRPRPRRAEEGGSGEAAAASHSRPRGSRSGSRGSRGVRGGRKGRRAGAGAEGGGAGEKAGAGGEAAEPAAGKPKEPEQAKAAETAPEKAREPPEAAAAAPAPPAAAAAAAAAERPPARPAEGRAANEEGGGSSSSAAGAAAEAPAAAGGGEVEELALVPIGAPVTLPAREPVYASQMRLATSLKDVLRPISLGLAGCYGYAAQQAVLKNVAEAIMNCWDLLIAGRRHRIVELEAYVHSPAHADPYCNGDGGQMECAAWYFHRNGLSFKNGSIKGLDVACGGGKGSKVHAGLLIRSVLDVEAELAGEESMTEGPCLVVDRILRLCNAPSITRFVAGRSVAELPAESVEELRLVRSDAIRHQRCWSAPRVGLTLRADEDSEAPSASAQARAEWPRPMRASSSAGNERLDNLLACLPQHRPVRTGASRQGRWVAYCSRAYRFTTHPDKLTKWRCGFAAAMRSNGAEASEVSRHFSFPPKKLEQYLAAVDAGMAHSDPWRFVNKQMTTQTELCEFVGACLSSLENV